MYTRAYLRMLQALGGALDSAENLTSPSTTSMHHQHQTSSPARLNTVSVKRLRKFPSPSCHQVPHKQTVFQVFSHHLWAETTHRYHKKWHRRRSLITWFSTFFDLEKRKKARRKSSPPPSSLPRTKNAPYTNPHID